MRKKRLQCYRPEAPDGRKAFETGMNDHIVKPVSTEAIAKVLDEIFAAG